MSILKNPFAILSLKLRKKPSKVTFSNGTVFQITWPQFRSLRDSYELVKKYRLQQISDEIFKITINSYQLIGSQTLMHTMEEMGSGVYEYNYQDKVVLDIGGFEGDSAVFFWSKGAKKIVIYEPVLEHHPYIHENIRLNNINAEVHAKGIGTKDDEIVVTYDKADNCFGLKTKKTTNKNKMKIKIKNVTHAIVESGADIAKIDCEGAEIALITVSNEILRKLEYIIIEVHTTQIRQQLIEKFKSAGFTMDRYHDGDNDNEISMAYFKRIPEADLSVL
jgi:FkbM family methyltransferase